MPDISPLAAEKIIPAQALELAQLVDLEARWENLRAATSSSMEKQSGSQMLHAKQKAYDVFRAKLTAYNKRYRPAHVPELLLNTPVRLGLWCQTMRDLYLQVEQAAQVQCPTHLVEKVYRWADRVADRSGRSRISRSNAPSTIRAVILELETTIQWCADLARVAPAA